MDCIFSCFQDYIEQVAFKEEKKDIKEETRNFGLRF